MMTASSGVDLSVAAYVQIVAAVVLRAFGACTLRPSDDSIWVGVTSEHTGFAPWLTAARVEVVVPPDVAELEHALMASGRQDAPRRSAAERREISVVRTGRPYTSGSVSCRSA